MADLNDRNSTLPVRIIGSNSNDVETDPIEATNGRLNVDAKFSKNNGQVDTSGRLRVTLPIELMSYYFANTDHTLKMNTTVTGGTGTVSLTLNKGSVTMSNTTGATDKLNFSTKKYVRYTPGQTHKCTIAGRIGLPKTNVEKRWGMFTEFNGFFFKQTSSGLSVVIRDGGAGDPVVETEITQANWNRDKLDGTGPSGINLNVNNQGIFVIEWDWHGSGVIKFGITYAHEVVYCHEFDYDFVQTDTSIRSPSMPVNVEIKNVGTVTGNTNVLISAVSVYKDGESELDANYSYSASRGVTSRTVGNGSETPLIAIRPKTSFKGILSRIGIIPSELTVTSITHPLYVKVVLNPATITGASWTSVNAESNAEFDISATAYTGGVIVWEGYVAAGTSLLGGDVPGTRDGRLGNWELGVSYNGTTPDVLLVVARSLANNTATYAALRWLENQ